MSIEAMKRIKSLLQDTKMIDSHTISAVVAECDMAILAKQPATSEPVGYMNEGHLHELAMRRLPYGYVYPEAGAGASTAVYTRPAPSVPGDVARDAARYRWLRDHDHWPAPFSSSQEPEPVRGRDLDAAIDAAMLAAK